MTNADASCSADKSTELDLSSQRNAGPTEDKDEEQEGIVENHHDDEEENVKISSEQPTATSVLSTISVLVQPPVHETVSSLESLAVDKEQLEEASSKIKASGTSVHTRIFASYSTWRASTPGVCRSSDSEILSRVSAP